VYALRAFRILAPLASVSVFTCMHLSAQQSTVQPARNAALLQMIHQFLEHPLRYSEYRKAFYDSANARADISIDITPSLMPWYCYADASPVKALDDLMTAGYLAGNMEAQLLAGVSGDKPVEGIEGVLKTYDLVRAKVRNYFVPELDKWLAFRSGRRIQSLVDSLRGASDDGCPTPKPQRWRGRVDLRPVPDTLSSR